MGLLPGQGPQKRLCEHGTPKSPGLRAIPSDSHRPTLQGLPRADRLTNLPMGTRLVGGPVGAKTYPIPKPWRPSQCPAHARPPVGKHGQAPGLAQTAQLTGNSARSSRVWGFISL